MFNNEFKNKVVVITGASSGLGREMAIKLSEEGAKLVLASRNEEKLREVTEICQRKGGEAIYVRTNVALESDCKNLIQKAVEKFSGIDVLINNAGITMYSLFEEIEDLSIFERLMRVNYLGSVYCTYYALPYLKRSRGRIVAVSSLTGKAGVPTRSGYAATKHAMVGFFDSIRIELARYGISVTIVYPGFVATKIRENALGKDGKPLGKSHIEEEKAMEVEKAAELILKAIARRKRELVMTLKGKIGPWIKLIAPGLVDKIAEKAIQRGKT